MSINSDVPYILRSPVEMNALIFSLLDPESLARVSRTCKPLRIIAHSVALEQFEKKGKLQEIRKYRNEDCKLAFSLNLAQNRIPDDLLPTFLTPKFKAQARSQAVFRKGVGNIDQLQVTQQRYSTEMVMRCMVETMRSPCYISYEAKIYTVFTIHHTNGRIETIRVWVNGSIPERKSMPCLKGYRKIAVLLS